MSEHTHITDTTQTAASSDLAGGFFRQRVLAKLSSLSGGRLNITDSLGRSTFGTAGDAVASAEKEIEVSINDISAYKDFALGGSLGVADAYVQGKWTCNNLTELLVLFVVNADQADALESGTGRVGNLVARINHWLNGNSIKGSKRNIHKHYDLGNEFFALFLDDTMTYSSGIFENEDATLYEASIAKLDRICRKLELKPQDKLIEIGTGWGSFALHAAKHYDCHVTTTTISQEQHDLAADRIKTAGLQNKIDLRLNDYRTLTNLNGQFDKLVSIEMIEAVGHKFLPGYFEACSHLLKQDGQALIQAISMPEQRYSQYLKMSDFIQQYIFPGSCCPSLGAMVSAIGERSDFDVKHIEDIGPHYAKTLARWRERFLEKKNEIKSQGFDENFIRTWEYYFSYCEAGFRERYITDFQIVLQKPGCRTEPLLGEL